MTPTIKAPETTPAALGFLGIGSQKMPSDFITHRGLPYSRVTVTLTEGKQTGVCDFSEHEADRFECAIADLEAELARRGHVPAWGDWAADLASMGEADLGDGWSAVVS